MNLPLFAGTLDISAAPRQLAQPAVPVVIPVAHRHPPASLPAAIAFLIDYGVSAYDLRRAALEARRQGVPPEAALLAEGTIREGFYYRCLAHRLRAQFTTAAPPLSRAARYPYDIHVGESVFRCFPEYSALS
jgi:hypothetical protein